MTGNTAFFYFLTEKKEYDQFVDITRSSGSPSWKEIAQSILIENGDLSTTSMTSSELS